MVESGEVKRSLRQSDLVKYSAVQSIPLKRSPVQSSVVMEVSDSQSRLYTSNKNALKWVKKSIARTAQLKKRRSFEVRRFLKSFPNIFFSQDLAFPRHQLTSGNTSNQKVAGGSWLNFNTEISVEQDWSASREDIHNNKLRYNYEENPKLGHNHRYVKFLCDGSIV